MDWELLAGDLYLHPQELVCHEYDALRRTQVHYSELQSLNAIGHKLLQSIFEVTDCE